MPMTLRPEITAMRAATADMERATSSDSEITREDFTPAAGSNSYSVTTGPGRTAVMRPLTPKSASTASSMRAFSSSASSDRPWLSLTGARLGQKTQRRQLIFAAGQIERGLLGALGVPGARLRASSRLTRLSRRSARRVGRDKARGVTSR